MLARVGNGEVMTTVHYRYIHTDLATYFDQPAPRVGDYVWMNVLAIPEADRGEELRRAITEGHSAFFRVTRIVRTPAIDDVEIELDPVEDRFAPEGD